MKPIGFVCPPCLLQMSAKVKAEGVDHVCGGL